MRKILTLVVCSLLAIWSVSAKDIASGTFKNGGTWKISYQGELYVDAVTVPDRIYTSSVSKIYWYEDPEKYHLWETHSVTPAPWDAYEEMIKSIRISNNTKTIGEWAFYGLGLVKEIIFESRSNADLVIKRNGFAYVGCRTTYGVKSLDLTCVKSIGTQAFAGCCGIRTVILGDNLTSVGDSVFAACSGLWEEGSYIKLPNNNTLSTNYRKLVPDTKTTLRSDGWTIKNFPYYDLSFVRYIAPMSKYGTYTSYAGSQNFKLYYGEIGYWLLSDGCLEIYRDMDYASPSDRPWHAVASTITAATTYTTTIGKNTFSGCSALHFVNSTGVEAHLDNITKIGDNAFYGCQQLKMVDMPRIQEIGNSAFENSGLTSVRFNSIMKNKANAQGFKTIGTNAFKNTPLEYIYVYGDCPQTSSNAFISLTSSRKLLYVPPFYSTQYEQAPWNAFEQVLEVDFPVKLWENNWGWELTADGTLTISGTANNLSWSNAQSVPWYPYRKYIRKVVVGSGITMIGNNAFAFNNEGESQIKSVEVPATVTSIGENAFKNNDQIEEVKAEGVQSIGNQAFENCSSLEQVKFGKDVASLGTKVFNNCGLVNVMAVKAATPPVVTAQTFFGLGVVSSNAPAKVKAKAAARRAKNATNATGQKAVSLDVPDAHISKYLAAQYWNLFSFEYIGEHGGIVESGQAYDGLYVLYSDSTMIVSASAPTDPQNINTGFNIPSSTLPKIKRLEIQGTLEKLGWQFRNCPNLEEVVLGPTFNSLNSSFYNCPKLKSINLDNILYLKSQQNGNKVFSCFEGCVALKEINIPNVLEIGDNCFKGCTGLTQVTLGGETEIGMEAFRNCSSLKRAALGNANLSGQAFQGCTALEEMSYDGTRMPAEIFKGCTSLHKVNLGGSLKDILSEAFANTAIDTIYIQCPTPPEAAADAFSGVTLSSIRGITPHVFRSPYSRASVWKDMYGFYDDEDYTELDFPIHFAIGNNGFGVVDESGNLTINAMGALVENVRDYVEPYAPYIIGEIRIGNEVSSLPAGTPYRLPFGWVKENGPRAIVLGSGLLEMGDYALYNNVWDCDLIVDCYALNPPVMNGANVFNWSKIQNGSQCVATLNVVNDAAVEAAYRADTYWKKFSISSWLAPADAPAECTVTFVDWDGTILQQTTTRPGMMVTPPADPVRPGYTFRGWDSQEYNWVVSDLTITATYYDETFTVRFYDWDGTLLSEQQVHYGQAAEAPADPTREGYTFLGWSEDFSEITLDRYIVAMYKNDHEGIEDIQTDKVPNIKVMIDGVIYILRDGKIYNLLGTQVR